MGSVWLRLERRAHVRVPRSWSGTIARRGETSQTMVTTHDVSMAGVSVQGEFDADPGDSVIVVIRLPGAAVSAIAEVTDSRELAAGRHEIGLRFTRFIGPSESTLASHLAPAGPHERPGPAFLAELVAAARRD